MPQSLASVYIHVVFSTKNRAPLITPDLRPRLYPYLAATGLGNGTKVLDIGGVPDHVHLLVSFGREVTIENRTPDVEATVLADGHPVRQLAPGDSVVVRLADARSLLATLPESTFFSRYRRTFAS